MHYGNIHILRVKSHTPICLIVFICKLKAIFQKNGKSDSKDTDGYNGNKSEPYDNNTFEGEHKYIGSKKTLNKSGKSCFN